MYLVSPDYLNTVTGNNSDSRLPPPPKVARKASGVGKKHNSSKRRRSVKNTKKKDTVKHEYDKGLKYLPNFRRRISKERDR